jgi:hypothetical protein
MLKGNETIRSQLFPRKANGEKQSNSKIPTIKRLIHAVKENIGSGRNVTREQFDCRSPTETETRMPASATSSSANVTEGRASTIVKVECLLS